MPPTNYGTSQQLIDAQIQYDKRNNRKLDKTDYYLSEWDKLKKNKAYQRTTMGTVYPGIAISEFYRRPMYKEGLEDWESIGSNKILKDNEKLEKLNKELAEKEQAAYNDILKNKAEILKERTETLKNTGGQLKTQLNDQDAIQEAAASAAKKARSEHLSSLGLTEDKTGKIIPLSSDQLSTGSKIKQGIGQFGGDIVDAIRTPMGGLVAGSLYGGLAGLSNINKIRRLNYERQMFPEMTGTSKMAARGTQALDSLSLTSKLVHTLPLSYSMALPAAIKGAGHGLSGIGAGAEYLGQKTGSSLLKDSAPELFRSAGAGAQEFGNAVGQAGVLGTKSLTGAAFYNPMMQLGQSIAPGMLGTGLGFAAPMALHMGLSALKGRQMRRIISRKKSPFAEAEKLSQSRELQNYIQQATTQGTIQPGETFMINLLRMIEVNTATNPALYTLMEKQEQDRDKSAEAGKYGLRGISLSEDDDKMNLLDKAGMGLQRVLSTAVAKYDIFGQLFNFMFTGKMPKDAVKDIESAYGETKAEKREREKAASLMGIATTRLKAMTIPPSSLISIGETFESKQLALQAVTLQNLQIAAQELITIRRLGHNIPDNIAGGYVAPKPTKEKIGDILKGAISGPFKALTSLPGVNAVYNIIEKIGTIGGSIYDFGEKAIGGIRNIFKPKDEADKKDIMPVAYRQLEVLKNLFSVQAAMFEREYGSRFEYRKYSFEELGVPKPAPDLEKKDKKKGSIRQKIGKTASFIGGLAGFGGALALGAGTGGLGLLTLPALMGSAAVGGILPRIGKSIADRRYDKKQLSKLDNQYDKDQYLALSREEKDAVLDKQIIDKTKEIGKTIFDAVKLGITGMPEKASSILAGSTIPTKVTAIEDNQEIPALPPAISDSAQLGGYGPGMVGQLMDIKKEKEEQEDDREQEEQTALLRSIVEKMAGNNETLNKLFKVSKKSGKDKESGGIFGLVGGALGAIKDALATVLKGVGLGGLMRAATTGGLAGALFNPVVLGGLMLAGGLAWMVKDFISGFDKDGILGGLQNAFMGENIISTKDTASTIGKWALIGAGVGSFVPVLGTAVGALAGAAFGGLIEAVEDAIIVAKEKGFSGFMSQLFLGDKEGGLMSAFKTMGPYALAGAITGSVLPGFGTLIGGLLGGAIGAIIGNIGADKTEKVVDSVWTMFKDALKSWGKWGWAGWETGNKIMPGIGGAIGALSGILFGSLVDYFMPGASEKIDIMTTPASIVTEEDRKTLVDEYKKLNPATALKQLEQQKGYNLDLNEHERKNPAAALSRLEKGRGGPVDEQQYAQHMEKTSIAKLIPSNIKIHKQLTYPFDSPQPVTSKYGMRDLYGRRFHAGTDFGAKEGTPVYSSESGKIYWAKPLGAYGKFVVVDHGDNLQTAYAHLSEIGVKEGQRVKRGEMIGKVGNTGIGTGPHLHYEVLTGRVQESVQKGKGRPGRSINPIAALDSNVFKHFTGYTSENYDRNLDSGESGSSPGLFGLGNIFSMFTDQFGMVNELQNIMDPSKLLTGIGAPEFGDTYPRLNLGDTRGITSNITKIDSLITDLQELKYNNKYSKADVPQSPQIKGQPIINVVKGGETNTYWNNTPTVSSANKQLQNDIGIGNIGDQSLHNLILELFNVSTVSFKNSFEIYPFETPTSGLFN